MTWFFNSGSQLYPRGEIDSSLEEIKHLIQSYLNSEGCHFSNLQMILAGAMQEMMREYIEPTGPIPDWVKGIRHLSWMDHMGSLNGKAVSEPYSISMEGIKDLVAFCEESNTTFTIWGESFHYPGRTLRILIEEPL